MKTRSSLFLHANQNAWAVHLRLIQQEDISSPWMEHGPAAFQCPLRLLVIQSDKALLTDLHPGRLSIGIIMKSVYNPELSPITRKQQTRK